MDAPPKAGFAVFMSAAAGCIGCMGVPIAFLVISLLATVAGLGQELWPGLVAAAIGLFILAVIGMRLVIWSPHFWPLWPLIAWWPWVLGIGYMEGSAANDRSGMVQLLAEVLALAGLAIAIGAIVGWVHVFRHRSLQPAPAS